MNIHPRVTKQVFEVSANIKNTVKEELAKSEVREELSDLPRMSLECVVPRKNIVRTGQKVSETFDVAKAIENFSDIKDTKTIQQICNSWKKDLHRIEKKFYSEEIPKEELYDAHQESLKELSKYDPFAEKIFNAMSSGKCTPEEAMKIFEKHIEPMLMKTQEVMRFIDNIPEIRNGYIKSSA